MISKGSVEPQQHPQLLGVKESGAHLGSVTRELSARHPGLRAGLDPGGTSSFINLSVAGRICTVGSNCPESGLLPREEQEESSHPVHSPLGPVSRTLGPAPCKPSAVGVCQAPLKTQNNKVGRTLPNPRTLRLSHLKPPCPDCLQAKSPWHCLCISCSPDDPGSRTTLRRSI